MIVKKDGCVSASYDLLGWMCIGLLGIQLWRIFEKGKKSYLIIWTQMVVEEWGSARAKTGSLHVSYW